MIEIAFAVAIVAALRGMWSPCGLSMLSALNPMAERARGHRYALTAGWYILGAALGGAVLGAICAGLAVVVAAGHLTATARALVFAAAAVVAGLSDSRAVPWHLPVLPRQVNERWIMSYRRWIYAGGFGAQVGFGFATYVMSGTVYLMAVAAALMPGPVAAFGVPVVFGLVRGASLLVSMRCDSPDRLMSVQKRIDEWKQRSLSACTVTSAAAAAAALWIGIGWLAATAFAALAAGVGTCRYLLRRRSETTLFSQPRRNRRAGLLASVVGVLLLLVGLGPSSGAATSAERSAAALAAPHTGQPAKNVPPPVTFLRACQFAPDASRDPHACDRAALAAFNSVRAGEGLGPMALPAGFDSMNLPLQLLVLTNLDRVDRGLVPVAGLAPSLNLVAEQAAENDAVPSLPDSGVAQGGNWAGGITSAYLAEWEWMYDDGPGSGNLDCRHGGESGCWAHRRAILAAYHAPVAMGAAVARTTRWVHSIAELFASGGAISTFKSPTWSTIAKTIPLAVSGTPASARALPGSSATTTVVVGASGLDADVAAKITSGARYWSVAPHTCSLSAGRTCTLTLRFAPTGSGPHPGTLTLIGPNGTQTIKLTGTGACVVKPFRDVATSNPFCTNITWLSHQNITKPADALYHPSSPVTRGSMTAFLFRLTHPGKPSPKCTSKPFPDVSTSDVFCGYIQWARSQHVAFGYPDGHFGPGNAVTRGAMAAFLHRIATGKPAPKCTAKPFDDVSVHSTFCGVITWMAKNGITYGVGDGTNYGTTQSTTRQQMAAFLQRIDNYLHQ